MTLNSTVNNRHTNWIKSVQCARWGTLAPLTCLKSDTQLGMSMVEEKKDIVFFAVLASNVLICNGNLTYVEHKNNVLLLSSNEMAS